MGKHGPEKNPYGYDQKRKLFHTKSFVLAHSSVKKFYIEQLTVKSSIQWYHFNMTRKNSVFGQFLRSVSCIHIHSIRSSVFREPSRVRGKHILYRFLTVIKKSLTTAVLLLILFSISVSYVLFSKYIAQLNCLYLISTIIALVSKHCCADTRKQFFFFNCINLQGIWHSFKATALFVYILFSLVRGVAR